ncbi:MAG: metallophosphoesterase [Acetanaerobacterium sp.]
MLRFAHLTDTHILRSYSASSLKEIIPRIIRPENKLKACLKSIRGEAVDFVMVTGDLAHEGDREDYRYLRAMFDKELPGVPVVAALGNHDRKDAFFRGYLGERARDAYYFQTNIQGLRVIVLDSSVAGQEEGELSQQQIDWFADVLRQPAERGSVLMLHHPIAWLEEKMSMQAPQGLIELLDHSDVRAVFCGHTHHNSCFMLGKVPQYAADSTAFGGVFWSEKVSFADTSGYSLASLSDNTLYVHHERVWPPVTQRVDFDLCHSCRTFSTTR